MSFLDFTILPVLVFPESRRDIRDPAMKAMETRKFYVYIVTNKVNGTLYTGVTGNLCERIEQHKKKEVEGFTKKYNLTRLVYYEEYENPKNAIYREKQLKKWKRQWKLNLIEKDNRDWKDLYFQMLTKEG